MTARCRQQTGQCDTQTRPAAARCSEPVTDARTGERAYSVRKANRPRSAQGRQGEGACRDRVAAPIIEGEQLRRSTGHNTYRREEPGSSHHAGIGSTRHRQPRRRMTARRGSTHLMHVASVHSPERGQRQSFPSNLDAPLGFIRSAGDRRPTPLLLV